MFCSQCGASLDNNARFCWSCEAKLDSHAQQEPTANPVEDEALQRESDPPQAPQISESVTESSTTPADSLHRIIIGSDGSIQVGNAQPPRTACAPQLNKPKPPCAPSLDGPEAWCLPAFYRRPIVQIRDALLRRSCRLKAATVQGDLFIPLTGGDFCIPDTPDVKDSSFGGIITVTTNLHSLPSDSMIPIGDLPADIFPSKAVSYITSEEEVDPIARIGSLLDYAHLGSVHRIASDDQHLIDQAKKHFASRLQAHGARETHWENDTNSSAATGIAVFGTTSKGEAYRVRCLNDRGKYELCVTFVYSDNNL